MKKLLLAAALLLLPLFAGAQEFETLLIPNGTFYTLEVQPASKYPDLKPESSDLLVLTARRGAETTHVVVPGSLTKGSHSNAAMAYDAESGMLFVFWLRKFGATQMESELLFASVDAEGVWSEVSAFGDRFNYRENLRIAVTTRTQNSDDNDAPSAGISVHAVWWDFDMHTGREEAKYALFAIEDGRVAETDFLDLSEFVNKDKSLALDVDGAILKQPILLTSQKQDSVLVTFGDLGTGRFQQVRVFPTRPPASNGRLRVPVGRRDGGFDAPSFGVAAHSGRVGAIFGGDGDPLAIYVTEEKNLHYVVYENGKWAAAKSIALDQQITRTAAIDAIRRLVSEH